VVSENPADTTPHIVLNGAQKTYAFEQIGSTMYAGGKFDAVQDPTKTITYARQNFMAFDAETGELLWQSAHPKLSAGRVNDWPLQGICSTPAVENGVVYYVSNRAEVIAADVDGFLDDENDGPFTKEGEMGMVSETTADGETKMVRKFIPKQ